MIIEYYRPQDLDEALSILAQPDTLPLGGGTLLSQPSPVPVKVVDLQSLGLNFVRKNGNNLELGATVPLQGVLESEHAHEALKTALKLEAPLNLRNAATVAGTLVSADGRSTFTTILLALDAKLILDGGPQTEDGQRSMAIGLGEFLPLRPGNVHCKLITQLELPLNINLAFESVARTPSDKPIVCAALARWHSGRTRLALSGFGKAPLLAMDGTESEGVEAAARNAFYEATDEWASAAYRMDVAATLAKRCLAKINL